MRKRFNKFLALCFICTLPMGVMTSCDDDDDNDSKKESVLNDKYTAEQGREDGKAFGEAAKKGSGMTVTEVSTMLTLASKYKNTEDKVYKAAFAEGAAAAGLLGDTSTGDNAIAKVDEIINAFDKYEEIKNGTQAEKVNAILTILNMFGNKQ